MRISDWSSDVCSSDLERVALVEAYAKAQGMWRDSNTPDPVFTDSLELDLASVEPSLAGPKRPQDRVPLSGVAASAEKALVDMGSGSSTPAEGCGYSIDPAHVVIAAITRSEEHTSELQSLMRISYAVFCLEKNKHNHQTLNPHTT